MRGMTASEVRRPVEPRMNLDVGRLTVREAAGLGGLAVAALGVATVGGLIAWAAGPHGYEDPANVSGWRFLLWSFGGLVAIVGWGLAVVICYLTVTDWLEYRRRLTDWHYAALDSFNQNGGVQIEQTLTQWELSAQQPLHVLAAALAVHQKVLAGEKNAHSVRQLAGPAWLGLLRLGDVPNGQAEALGKTFEQLKLITGRAPRSAGEWAPKTADDVVRLVMENWPKVKPGEPARVIEHEG